MSSFVFFRARPAIAYSLVLALGMTVVVGTALGFQYIGGYIPCALCLMQRQPYYYGIPVALLASVAAVMGWPTKITRILIAVAGVLMLAGAGLGAYHAGVEWGFWEGPSTCSTSAASLTNKASDLLDQLNSVKGPSCTEAAWRMLGLSFAGWNVITSLGLALIAFQGFRKMR